MSEGPDNGSASGTPPMPAAMDHTGSLPVAAAVRPATPFEAAAPPAAPGPAASAALKPKCPPLLLAGPGELLGASSAFGGLPAECGRGAPAAQPTPAPAPGPAALAAADAQPAPAPPHGGEPAPISPPPVPASDSPWQQPAAADAAPAAQPAPAAAPAAPAASADNPLAVTNSPWETTANVDAELLPSANVLQSAGEPPAAPEPPPELSAAARRSRVGMTVGLAVAAVALIAAVIYFTVFDRHGEDDPTKVDVGSEQRDYGDEPLPSAPASAAAKPNRNKPVYRAPPRVRKPSKEEDIYDDL